MAATPKKVKLEEQINEEGIKTLGKHVSREKALGLMAVTLLVCAMPVVMGLRHWADIPQMVETGLIGTNGQDDSLPRWAVVFLIPGLMFLLNGIEHVQLLLHQNRMKVPPKQIRVLGRWGIPIVGTFFSSAIIRFAVGETMLPPFFAFSCVLSLAMMILGSRLWDCPMDAVISLRHALNGKESSCGLESWQRLHRFAGIIWLAAGLLVLLDTMLNDQISVIGATALLAAVVIPELWARRRG